MTKAQEPAAAKRRFEKPKRDDASCSAGGSAAGAVIGAAMGARAGAAVGGRAGAVIGGAAGAISGGFVGKNVAEKAGTEQGQARTSAVNMEKALANQMIASFEEESSDVRNLCERYRLTREELGRLTGFSLRALADWSAGRLPSDPARRRLREVNRLLEALSRVINSEQIPTWLHRRNSAFGNITPLQVIELGEIDRLWAMVHEVESGYTD